MRGLNWAWRKEGWVGLIRKGLGWVQNWAWLG